MGPGPGTTPWSFLKARTPAIPVPRCVLFARGTKARRSFDAAQRLNECDVGTEQDSGLYCEWVNDPVVRATARVQYDIAWADHQAWFRRRLETTDARLCVAEADGESVGQIRFELIV